MPNKRLMLVTSILLLAWSGFVVTAYFVSHKPLVIQVANSILHLAWSLAVTSMLLLNAIAMGQFTIIRLVDATSDELPVLLLAGGIGLGGLGLL